MNGLIKQNITIRMGFRHADLINCRITNTIGAEKIGIEEKGRFVLKMDETTEIQAPYLTEKQAEKILKTYKSKKLKNAENIPLNEFEKVDKENIDIFGVLD